MPIDVHDVLSFANLHLHITTTERGVFLSIVDMMLNNKEKQNLDNSVIGKCWGRAFVIKQNLKLLYQDWRAKLFQNTTDTDKYFLCHDTKVARESGITYTNNAMEVWEEMFANKSSWPTVILMNTRRRYNALLRVCSPCRANYF